MQPIYLSDYSLGFLSNAILSFVTGIAFISGGVRSVVSPIISLSFFSNFISSLIWLSATMSYGERVFTGYLFLLPLAISATVIQLIYRYPKFKKIKESKYIFWISIGLLFLTYKDYFPLKAGYSFAVHSQIFYLPRSFAVQLIFSLWSLFLLGRQVKEIEEKVRVKEESQKQKAKLPKRSVILRLLIFLFALFALWATLPFLVAVGFISAKIFLLWYVVLLLFGQIVFVYVYLAFSKEPVSFLVKVVGLSLVGIVFVVQLLLLFTLNWIEKKYDAEHLNKAEEIITKVLRQEGLPFQEDIHFILQKSESLEVIYLKQGYSAELLSQKIWGAKNRFYLDGSPPSLGYEFEQSGKIFAVGFSYVTYREYIHEYLIRFAFLLLALVLLTLLILPTLFYTSFMRPLRRLVASLENMRQGQWGVKLTVVSHDELGFLTQSFNRMVTSIERADEQIRRYTEKLEEMVGERTQELRLRMREIEEANIALQREIERREKLEKELMENQRFIQSITQSSPQVLFVYDIKENRLKYLNHDAFHTGKKIEGLRTNFFKDILYPEDLPIYENWLNRLRLAKDEETVDVEFRVYKEGENPYWIFTRAIVYSRDEDGSVRAIIGTSIDVTERKVAEERVLYLARHDSLTGLPNRLRLQERFYELVNLANYTGEKVALLFIDLDRFKWVNDTLGHETGDQLLRSVAENLRRCVRERDVLSRWGGDEFVILLSDQDIYNRSQEVAHCILSALSEPFFVNGQEILINGSIGIAIYPDHDQSVRNLLRKADLAMYLAKEKGRANFCFYEMNLERKTEHLRLMEIELRRALEKNEFFMQYQPIYSIDQEKLVGVESLLRWRHPEKGVIYPSEFLEIAEETGQIIEIGRLMLKQVLMDAKLWLSLGYLIPVTFNISNRQFRSENISKIVKEILQETNFPAEFLELELTEGILFDSTVDAEAQLQSLRELGVKLSLDDFGTGYSSLGYLKKISVNKLKIDKSFVSDLGSGVEDEPFVAAIVAIARALKLPTVAEGVEKEEQLQYLRRIGVDYIQGFLFGRPMDIETFLEILKRKKPPFVKATLN